MRCDRAREGKTMREQNSMPGPGLHRGVSFDEYTSWDAANAHGLSILTKRTPAHLRYELDHGGSERTEALDIGYLLHLAVLEPDKFAAQAVIAPKVDKRTKAGKQEWLEFEAAHIGASLVAPEKHSALIGMRDAVYAHPTAREFLMGPGMSEVSAVWEEEGMPCKLRADRIGRIGASAVIGDLKTALCADRRTFERAVYTYGYHLQGAHYVSGVEHCIPQPEGNPHRRYIFIVVEKDPPYCVALYEIDDAALGEGDTRRKQALRTWRKCRETGQWPGYSEGMDTVSLPAWAFEVFDNSADL